MLRVREQYLFLITKFAEHFKLDSLDSILTMSKEELKMKVEDYVILFKNNGKSTGYIRLILFALQSFCESNDYEGINWKKIRKRLGKKQKPKKSRPFTTEEIKLMYGTVTNLRSKAIILFLSASGVRRGALPELKVRNLKEMPNDCLAITVYENSNEEYITFINKEAKDSLTRYFEKRKSDGDPLNPDSPVFRTKYPFGSAKAKAISEKTVSNLIHRAKSNAGINLENAPNMLCHAFRRRFNTILKLNDGSNPVLIERLMGHDMKLDNSYFQPTLDDLFTEYKKGISYLVIEDKERVLEEKKKLQSENDELMKVNAKLKEVQMEKDEMFTAIVNKAVSESRNEMTKLLDERPDMRLVSGKELEKLKKKYQKKRDNN